MDSIHLGIQIQVNHGTCSGKSQSRPSPSEGPKEHGNYHYYRDSISHLHMPFLASSMKTLTKIAAYAAGHVYKFLSVVYPNNNKRKQMLFCRLGIFTMEISCTLHTNQNDKRLSFQESVVDNLNYVEKQLDIVQKCKHVNTARKEEAKTASSFIKYWGLGIPTTCCYQYVCHRHQNTTPITIYHYFCMQGFDLCRRIQNYWTHSFFAYIFVHGTSVLLYVSNGLVFVGKHG